MKASYLASKKKNHNSQKRQKSILKICFQVFKMRRFSEIRNGSLNSSSHQARRKVPFFLRYLSYGNYNLVYNLFMAKFNHMSLYTEIWAGAVWCSTISSLRISRCAGRKSDKYKNAISYIIYNSRTSMVPGSFRVILSTLLHAMDVSLEV